MKFLMLMFPVMIYGLSSVNSPINAQSGILFSIRTTNADNVDSAKSLFGLNEMGCTIFNTSVSQVKIRAEGSEFKIGNTEWVKNPDDFPSVTHYDGTLLHGNDSINSTIMVSLFSMYLDSIFNMESLMASGGVVDYRVVYTVVDGNTVSVNYSPVIHIVVPTATLQDAAALQYVMQQKSACPEIEYFFAGVDMSTYYCNYVYEYLIANFPETLLGKVSKYTMAQRECLLRRAQINSLPEVKASIINTRDMLLSSDIPYIKRLARYLDCANN